MAGDAKVDAFIYYVLQGFYRQNPDAHGQLLVLNKADLQTILEAKRIGSAQRAQLRDACIHEGIAVAELSDRFIFFEPQDMADRTFKITPRDVSRLSKETREFARLRSNEADEEWDKRYGSEHE